jgi:hypothetical protein
MQNPSDSRTPGAVQSQMPAEAASETRESINENERDVERRNAVSVDPAGNMVADQVEIYEDNNLFKVSLRYWFTATISFLFGVLEVILGLRLVFRLLGAYQGNDFTNFLYNLSDVFVVPFNGIFNDQTVGKQGVFEFSTLVAMLIYALIALGLVALTRLVLFPNYSGYRQIHTIRKQQLQ